MARGEIIPDKINKTESLGIFFLKAHSYLPDENLVDTYVFDTGSRDFSMGNRSRNQSTFFRVWFLSDIYSYLGHCYGKYEHLYNM